MNIDLVRESINMPLLEKGQHVVVQKVGAYNMTQWMQFITLRPNVVMIDRNNNIFVIRKAETNELIQSSENIPDHLRKSGL
jgi:diaminopimelate decarboxylase